MGILALGQFEETGPNHALVHAKSYPEFSASHCTSTEALLNYQDDLRVELYLFQGIWGFTAISGSWAAVPLFFSNCII